MLTTALSGALTWLILYLILMLAEAPITAIVNAVTVYGLAGLLMGLVQAGVLHRYRLTRWTHWDTGGWILTGALGGMLQAVFYARGPGNLFWQYIEMALVGLLLGGLQACILARHLSPRRVIGWPLVSALGFGLNAVSVGPSYSIYLMLQRFLAGGSNPIANDPLHIALVRIAISTGSLVPLGILTGIALLRLLQWPRYARPPAPIGGKPQQL